MILKMALRVKKFGKRCSKARTLDSTPCATPIKPTPNVGHVQEVIFPGLARQARSNKPVTGSRPSLTASRRILDQYSSSS